MLRFAKYFLSFFKTNWELKDYPIQIIKQDSDSPKQMGRYRLVAWRVQIINWPQMFGAGDTREEALNMLNRNFDAYRQKHNSLPRPGTHVPIKLASSKSIKLYTLIARDFFQRILQRDFDKCFISDESSLWDFPETEKDVFRYIHKVYGVDVSDILDGNLAKIFKRLQEKQLADNSQIS